MVKKVFSLPSLSVVYRNDVSALILTKILNSKVNILPIMLVQHSTNKKFGHKLFDLHINMYKNSVIEFLFLKKTFQRNGKRIFIGSRLKIDSK